MNKKEKLQLKKEMAFFRKYCNACGKNERTTEDILCETCRMNFELDKMEFSIQMHSNCIKNKISSKS